MKRLQRVAALVAITAGAFASAGCTTALVLVYAHGKLTEGDAAPCVQLSSVERALLPRCGPFVTGSLLTKDVTVSSLSHCPLTLAARDRHLWPVLPELLAKGAMPEACRESPLVALAQSDACPDFSAASQAEVQSLRWLAEADARSIHHDAVRMLSCPSARAVGLDTVLHDWLALGLLPAQGLAFSPLGALHPDYLDSSFARAAEVHGHTARAALGAYAGRLPEGFEEALRTSHWQALDWWVSRLPDIVNRVPATQGNQLPWLPLVRVLTPSFMPDVTQQRATVEYLLARGADPTRRLPHEPTRSVMSFARELRSPLLAVLEAPPRVAMPTLATTPIPAYTTAGTASSTGALASGSTITR